MPLTRFGTMEDFDELIGAADKRDIKIVMDLVVNHCRTSIPGSAALKDPHYADYLLCGKLGRPTQ